METFSMLLALCAGNSPAQSRRRGALMFSLIWVWINIWVNNHEAGDSRCHCAHCEVTVMNTFTHYELLMLYCDIDLGHHRARRFPLPDGPGQVKLPVAQVDLDRFFFCISYKQIEESQNSWESGKWWFWEKASPAPLAWVMAWCLAAPVHYLNQCRLIISEVMWLSHVDQAPSHNLNQCLIIISEVLWHSYVGNFTGNAINISILQMILKLQNHNYRYVSQGPIG